MNNSSLDAWVNFQKEMSSFLRSFLIIDAIILICCVTSRAPSLISKFEFYGFSVNASAGFIVVFAPIVSVFLLFWRYWAVMQLVEYRANLKELVTVRERTHIFDGISFLIFFFRRNGACNNWVRPGNSQSIFLGSFPF